MPKNPIKRETIRNNPRSEVPLLQASVATKNLLGPYFGTLPEGAIITGGHGGVSRRGLRHHEGKGPEGGGRGGRSTRGRTSPPLFRWRRSAIGRGIIATVIVFINITIIITIPPLSTAVHSPATRCILYLNMVLYATYYDPMMCCHPMMF